MNGLQYGISSQAVTVSRTTRVPRSGPTPESAPDVNGEVVRASAGMSNPADPW